MSIDQLTEAPGCGGGAVCAGCPAKGARGRALERLGVAAKGVDYVVALLGSPNTGKSTIFNALTGLRQHVGNWVGKTVARAEGAYRAAGHSYKVVDLPGSYTLSSSSHHEEIARDFLLFGDPSVTVVVVDATRLERNLVLVLQTLEITNRVVVALNLMDEAKRHGLNIDVRALERRLGVPVVPMVARRSEGLQELINAIGQVATGEYQGRQARVSARDEALQARVDSLTKMVEEAFPSLPNAHWVALRLLENDHSIINAIREGTLGELQAMENGVMPSLNRMELQEEL